MDDSRTRMVLGDEGTDQLKNAHVAVFGLGGVGGFACEALARAGVGELTLVDFDRVDASNINRQIIALTSTVGELKTDVMEVRIRDINPDANLHMKPVFYMPDEPHGIDFAQFDYVLDCVDTVKAKLGIIESAQAAGVPVISAMGAGNKIHPERFEIMDVFKTTGDPLARVIRHECRKRGIRKLKVVCSPEAPMKIKGERTPGSLSFVPSVMGLLMAGEVIRSLAGK